MTVLYIDILLVLNLFIDYLLLAATARIQQRPVKRRRLILGALTGALSSLIILLPPLSSILTFLYKAVCALLMAAVTFSFRRPPVFLKSALVLLVISTVFSGVCTAGYHLFSPVGLFVQSGVVYYNVSPLLLVMLTTISYGLLCLFDRLTRKRVALGFAYRLEITDDDYRVTLRALLDSGHSLRDSFSGSPVILVKEACVRPLRDRYDITSPACLKSGRIRYIPFSSIGGDGVLAAFRPAKVMLYADGRAADISGVWIATTTVLGRGEYDALISPAVSDLLCDRLTDLTNT